MYEKIIVPTDGSDLSLVGLKEGLKAAKIYDIPALAVYVLTPDTMSGMAAHRFDDVGKETMDILREHRKKEGKKVLEKVQKMADKLGVELKTTIEEGEPYEEITKLADKNDMIYMCSHGRSGLSSLFIGSTTDRVIKHTDATVAVVKAKNENK
ncbi:MAG: universal stress protein [Candidatus Thermoplasmatota archaeon]|nr:universal stress protein [Candidatus Thermoplasmatota archaeon]